MAGAFYRQSGDRLLVFLRVTPNAGADSIDGPEARDDGSTVLRLRVRAVPDKGKANAATLALLAKALGIPKSTLTLVSGDTARLKTVAIDGDAETLIAPLEALG